jgi:hypothetical protein
MTIRKRLTSLCLILAVPVGCTTSDPGAKTPDPDAMMQTTGTQKQHVELVFHLRQQASECREMAERREFEADLLMANGGPSMEETVKRKQALAPRLHAAADPLDEKAREAQWQVPHGMVQ